MVMRLVLNLRGMKTNMKNFFLYGNLRTEDEIRKYIKDYAEWDDVAEKMGETHTREDYYCRDYEEPRTDMTISEMEKCFEEYVDGVIEAIKMGEEIFNTVYQELGYKFELRDSDATIECSSSLAITDWAQIRKEEIAIPDACEVSGYKINHPKENNLTKVDFTAYVILTEEEWKQANEQITSGKCSLETIFRDKFNNSAKENKFTIYFERKDL